MKIKNLIQRAFPLSFLSGTKENMSSQTKIQYVETDVKFNKLAEQVAALVNHYDMLVCQTTDSNAQVLLKDFSQRLINTLIINGCTPISDDTTYDQLRHITQSAEPVPAGTPIKSFIRIGVQLDNKVLIPAIVTI